PLGDQRIRPVSLPQSQWWLVLDIGNTHTVAGIYSAPEAGKAPKGALVRFRTDRHATADEYRTQLTQLFLYSKSFEGKGEAGDEPPGALNGPSGSRTRSEGDPQSFGQRIDRVIVSTVVPPLESVVRNACAPHRCLFISSETPRDFEL